jgi:hypothetical protein
MRSQRDAMFSRNTQARRSGCVTPAIHGLLDDF